MKPCINCVDDYKCRYCESKVVKFGKARQNQRYRCKSCGKTQMLSYRRNACNAETSANIVDHLIEGCGIRSIARLLKISATTVICYIKHIASQIKKPQISMGRTYEVDELKTYIKNKRRDYWMIYALDRQSGQVVDFNVGKRAKANLQKITDILLPSHCNTIYTDGLNNKSIR